DDETAERVENRLADRAVADRGEQLLLERLEAAVEQVFLRREVVEDGCGRHIGCLRHLGHRDVVEAALCKERQSGVCDGRACLLLLPLAKTGSRHELRLALRWFDIKFRFAIKI